LVFKEIEQVLARQLDNFQAITARAGTVLSVLIGSIVATLTVAGVVGHPPAWAIVVPSIPLLGAIITSCWVFLGSEVGTGPTPESLAQLASEPEAEVREALIGFYSDTIAGSDDFVGNRKLLHTKQRLFEVSVVLLAITVSSLIVSALLLYWV
jgi:hypothetical protein